MKSSDAEILGWDGVEDLHEAYRRAAKRTHPDRGGSVERFNEVKEAYDRLRKRQRFSYAELIPKVDMNESKFQKMVIRSLKDTGAMTFNVHGHAMQAAGWPDIYVAHPKWQGWIELKVTARLRDLQVVRIEDLLARDVNAFVLRWKEERVIASIPVNRDLVDLEETGWKEFRLKPLGFLEEVRIQAARVLLKPSV